MIEFLKNIDTDLFLFLNGIHSDFFDSLMWWISNKYVWIPLYAYLLYLLIKKYGKKSILPVVTIILLIIVTDQLSVHLFKNMIQRYRPTHNLDISELVHTVNNYKGGIFGFISSHAANSFGIATLLLLFLKNKHISLILIFWAIIVSYSRIYLGVHFPGDIACGGLFGIIIAFILYRLYLISDKFIFQKKNL